MMPSYKRFILFLTVFIFIISGGCGGGGRGSFIPPDNQSNFSLGIARDSFTVNGAPAFLLGVSYFDGRNYRQSDLRSLAEKGYNLIRIFINLFFDQDGDWRSGAEQDLIDLVDFADGQGIIVDVTILDNESSLGEVPSVRNQVVMNVTEALKGRTNVLFDLQNEHDLSHSELGELSDLVRSIDPDRIVTVSSGEKHILFINDDLQEDNIDEEVDIVKVDILTPHLERNRDWFDMTGHRVGVIKDYLSSIGKNIPVYLQEEARRGHSGLNPSKEEFITAALQARDADAAGWIFHTDAGFNLSDQSFFERLDSVERAVVEELPCRVFGGSICN